MTAAHPAAEDDPTAGPQHHLRTAVPLAAAVVSGSLVALQQRINGELGTSLHAPLLAAVVSFGTGLVAVAAVVLLRGSARGRLQRVRSLP
ncbi:MAG: DMT family transporter, partial [Mycobacteriales bacterium]